jgi:hypothetical protein
LPSSSESPLALSSLDVHHDFVLDFIFGSHMRSVPPCRSGSLHELRSSGIHDFDRREEMLEISLQTPRDFLLEICEGIVRQADRAK